MYALRLRLKEAANMPIMKNVVGFFDGNVYPVAYALLVLLSSLLGLEIFLYVLTCAIEVLTSCIQRVGNIRRSLRIILSF